MQFVRLFTIFESRGSIHSDFCFHTASLLPATRTERRGGGEQFIAERRGHAKCSVRQEGTHGLCAVAQLVKEQKAHVWNVSITTSRLDLP